jgi:hypothetical protein
MLQEFQLEDKFDEVKTWYNGYLMGNVEIYNPWSIVNFIFTTKFSHPDEKENPDELPSEWANSSSNTLVKNLIKKYASKERANFETLLSGGSISVPISQTQTFSDFYSNSKTIWSVLLFTGYLRPGKKVVKGKHDLSIPNQEIMEIFKFIIQQWLNNEVKPKHKESLFNALINEDEVSLQTEISAIFLRCISFWDASAEGYYHGFLTSTFDWFDEFDVQSNREKGEGRPDIQLEFPKHFTPT